MRGRRAKAGFALACALVLASAGAESPASGEEPPSAPPAVSATPNPPAAGTAAAGGAASALLGTVMRKDVPIEITSDELEMLQADSERQLIFRSNVRVVQADMVLLSERLDAFYPEGASQPERLIASGKVRFQRGERHARCDKAVYRREAEQIVCSGNAELKQGCDRVRGREIHFDLRRERVRVLGSPSVSIFPEGTDPARGCREGAP